MSIPVWEYDVAYYRALMEPTGLDIRTDPVKGKGLFTRRAWAKGEVVHMESCLCCTQNLDDANRGVPVCGNCLVSLESPQEIVRRVSGKAYVGSMPAIEAYRPPEALGCLNALTSDSDACTAVYCSVRCREQAWTKHHYALCQAKMTPKSVAALAAFMGHSWTESGVDFSDTHFLALKFIGMVISRHRMHRMPLEQAYAPVAQLIRSPLQKFAFSYLLMEDYEESVGIKRDIDKADAERYLEFKTYQFKPPEDNPVVLHARAKGPTRDHMMVEAIALLNDIFVFSPEEAAFFTPERWSSLLGAVLLNGQERSPNSPYTDYAFIAKKSGNASALRSFQGNLRSNGIDTSKLDGSTRGQGVYTIGACFNHSCDPNVQVSYCNQNDETLVVLALRDIAAEEELFISYIDEAKPFIHRQQQLFEHYLFTCLCTKCQREAPTAPDAMATSEKSDS